MTVDNRFSFASITFLGPWKSQKKYQGLVCEKSEKNVLRACYTLCDLPI